MEHKAIVICATIKRLDWLNNCLASFNGYNDYPIIPVINNHGLNYELDTFKWIFQETRLEEFILMQDSMEVINPEIFKIAFDYQGPVSLSSSPLPFGNFHGKFITEHLKKLILPEVRSKKEEVDFETMICTHHAGLEFLSIKGMEHTNNFVEKFNRKNMVVSSAYIRKYKSCWDDQMAKDYEKLYNTA
jgi:hypothetical protein